MNARSLPLTSIFVSALMPEQAPQCSETKMPRLCRGIHLIGGEGGCRTYPSKSLSVAGFRRLTISRSPIGPRS